MIKDVHEYLEIIDNDELYYRCKEPANDSVWIELIKNYPNLHQHIVLNKTLSATVLECLAHSNNSNVRWHIANKRSLNTNTFELLSRDVDSMVRYCIAHNPNTSKIILELLAKDICEDIFDDGQKISDIAKNRLQEAD